MSNSNNLRPFRSAEEARARGRKGGIASGKARREKKTVQKILNDFLNSSAKDNVRLSKLADQMGLEGDESIKYLFTLVCTINTLKKGTLSDLELLVKLLGEQTEIADNGANRDTEDDPLTKSLKEEAERMQADHADQ